MKQHISTWTENPYQRFTIKGMNTRRNWQIAQKRLHIHAPVYNDDRATDATETLLKAQNKNKVSINRKYHNLSLQTNPRHHEEEPQNIYSNNTSVCQLKQNNTSFLFLNQISIKQTTDNEKFVFDLFGII